MNIAELCKKEWHNMPEYVQQDLTAYKTFTIKFRTQEAVDKFSNLINVKIHSNKNNKSVNSYWYPKKNQEVLVNKYYISNDEDTLNPKYPIYIISKGRWESRYTSKALEKIKVPYKIVVEPQEYEEYAKVISPEKILTLPFSNLGQGSIPARNWVWDHSLKNGDKRHWILDDNIHVFYRLNNNLKIRVSTGTIFNVAETFVERYENIGLAGFQYESFAPRLEKHPPFRFNTRIYSCILIKNDLVHRWRGKYNEDTDLSLRVLKDKQCTVLFYAFLADKISTMTMKGGNTEDLYQDDGRLKMAESLRDQHPDIVKVVWKWHRWQHQVDYSQFKKTELIRVPDVVIPEEINNYGMELKLYDKDTDVFSDYVHTPSPKKVKEGFSDDVFG